VVKVSVIQGIAQVILELCTRWGLCWKLRIIRYWNNQQVYCEDWIKKLTTLTEYCVSLKWNVTAVRRLPIGDATNVTVCCQR